MRAGRIYALPVSIDTLAMIYNKDRFNQAGIVFPPTTWDEFEERIPSLTKLNGETISRSAAAIGASSENIHNGAHLLELFMLQEQAAANDNSSFGLNTRTNSKAFEFYASFANPASPRYTWNDTMPYSLGAFSSGQTAVIFDYASTLPDVRSSSNVLNIGIAPIPQIAGTNKAVAYANYWGYAVSAQSAMSQLAWSFILSMTTSPQVAESYMAHTGKPPALLELININIGSPGLDAFARQALIATSWNKVDGGEMDRALSEAIRNTTRGISITTALREADSAHTAVKNRWLK
jgi:multiple sugar transport system substrate-binding protein